MAGLGGDAVRSSPALVGRLRRVLAVSAGSRHTVVLARACPRPRRSGVVLDDVLDEQTKSDADSGDDSNMESDDDDDVDTSSDNPACSFPASLKPRGGSSPY
jgi:hypothetical protein